MLNEMSHTERQILHYLTCMCKLKELHSQKQRMVVDLPGTRDLGNERVLV
jgi:hypothetical protein